MYIVSLPTCPNSAQLGEVCVKLCSPARSLSDVLERKRGPLNEGVFPAGGMTERREKKRQAPAYEWESLDIFGMARGGMCPR